jgi:hypothetical protein
MGAHGEKPCLSFHAISPENGQIMRLLGRIEEKKYEMPPNSNQNGTQQQDDG